MREQLDLLEEKLQALGKKEKILIALAIPFIVVLLFYYFYVINALQQQQSNEKKIAELAQKLKKHNEKILLRKIVQKKKDILSVKDKIATKGQKLNYLDAKLSQNHFLFLSQKDFTYFLNNLLSKSVQKHFLIKDIKIEKKDKNYIEKIKYKKSLQIEGTGNFLHTLTFLRDIEENNMLFELKNIVIETNGSTPQTTFDIDFYGIEK